MIKFYIITYNTDKITLFTDNEKVIVIQVSLTSLSSISSVAFLPHY